MDSIIAVQAAGLPEGYTYEDLRNTELLFTNPANENVSTLKYEDRNNRSDNETVIRYPDVLLMWVE